jgi:hypothetical protein
MKELGARGGGGACKLDSRGLIRAKLNQGFLGAFYFTLSLE